MAKALSRTSAKYLFRRWGETERTIADLEYLKALARSENKGTALFDQQIANATRLEARVDNWMNDHLTIRDAKFMILFYINGMKYTEIAEEMGFSEECLKQIHGMIINLAMETWED